MAKNGTSQFWIGIAITVGMALSGAMFNLYGRLVEQETKIESLEKQLAEHNEWLSEILKNLF